VNFSRTRGAYISQVGKAGPRGPAGIDQNTLTAVIKGVSTKTTVLLLTKDVDAGMSFFVNSGGTHYTKTGDDGDLGVSEIEFLSSPRIQFWIGGVKLIKQIHLLWLSRYSFTVYQPFQVGDFFEILS
jgi:hypothetical protein